MITEKEMLAESQLSQKEKDKFWNYLPTQLDKRDLWKYLFHSAIFPKAYGLNYDFINKLSFETISKAFGEHGIHFEERHNSKEKPKKTLRRHFVARIASDTDHNADRQPLRLRNVETILHLVR